MNDAKDIDLRIDHLVSALAKEPDRSDLKLKLALYLSMKRKIEKNIGGA